MSLVNRTFWFLAVIGLIAFVVNMASGSLFAQTYTDLHDFNCAVEGCSPQYPAILAQGRDGNLYGTTSEGGTAGMGTVFKIAPSGGSLTTLYNFSGADGQNPDGGLILGTDGNFYGTTRFGGAKNLGTVFKITAAGALTTLHNFDGTDGSEPRPGLVQGKNGAFYGTTCGFNAPWTAYSITSSGKFKTINGTSDVRIAACSFAPLTLGNDGNLYGTNPSGGVNELGSVFRLTPGGALKVIYAADGAHGTEPFAPVVQGNDGFLYGTASGGGSGQFGVVFKLSIGGKFTALHEFGLDLNNDGTTPYAGLVAASDGKFYGAASDGENSGSVPNGNLFSMTSGGAYDLLYAFDGTHGYLAQATPMQHTNGMIFGVAEGGGADSGGVLYSLDNGLPPFVSLLTRWGTAGQKVEILGTGLTGTSSVKFGSATASFSVLSDTYMTADIPDDGTTGFVTVITPTGTLTSNRSFTVTPVISGIAPTSGPIGTQVTITGSGLIGTTQVTFGGVKATAYTVNSGTTITATVPAGAKTGKVTLKTAGGSASSKGVFTITP